MFQPTIWSLGCLARKLWASAMSPVRSGLELAHLRTGQHPKSGHPAGVQSTGGGGKTVVNEINSNSLELDFGVSWCKKIIFEHFLSVFCFWSSIFGDFSMISRPILCCNRGVCAAIARWRASRSHVMDHWHPSPGHIFPPPSGFHAAWSWLWKQTTTKLALEDDFQRVGCLARHDLSYLSISILLGTALNMQ